MAAINHPNEKRYKYEDGIWWHICEHANRDGGEINWNGYMWLLRPDRYIGVISVRFCPWCGIKLRAMPKEDERSLEDVGY